MTMNRYVLRGILGTFAGLVSSVVLAGALGSGLLGVVLGRSGKGSDSSFAAGATRPW
jgi:hypothetical protein